MVMMNTTGLTSPTPHSVSPFFPARQHEYNHWRDTKLYGYPKHKADLMVAVEDPGNLTQNEARALQSICAKTNFAIYVTKNKNNIDKNTIRNFCSALGLIRLDSHLYAAADGVSAIEVSENRRQGEYIPYTKQRIRWHTDGYYNVSSRQIRGMLLHCVNPASKGGDNMLLDHEIAYILTRDENPAFIKALMQPDALTIPANIIEGKVIREAVTGPVFSVDPQNGTLHMRYSARQRNVEWKQDNKTMEAAEFLQNLWNNPPKYVFHHKLKAGQGLLSNNILHGREAFEDDRGSSSRLLYRVRAYDRITGTDTRPDTMASGKIQS